MGGRIRRGGIGDGRGGKEGVRVEDDRFPCKIQRTLLTSHQLHPQ